MPLEKPTTPCCSGLSQQMNQWREGALEAVRKEPIKAAGYAFVGGLICAIFPVGRVLGSLLRLALALARPGLLVLGLVKVFEEIDRRGT